MAVLTTGQKYDNQASYDKESGRILVVHRYHIQNVLDENFYITTDEGLVPNGIPASVVIPGVRPNQGAVDCYMVTREMPERFSPDTGMIDVTYEGYEMGVMTWHPTVSTTSQTLVQDWDGNQIGPEGQGTNILKPVTTYTVIQNHPGNASGTNADRDAYLARLLLISRLTGVVNEEGWLPGFRGDGEPFLAGSWLYLGAQGETNRNRTVTFTHKFLHQPDIFQEFLNLFVWYNVRPEKANESIAGEDQGVTTVNFGESQDSRIYRTAGEEDDNLENVKFSGLEL